LAIALLLLVAGDEKTTPIVGWVRADVESPVFGAGLGPKYAAFIFGVEQSGALIISH
jgi:hypothetical protein